MSNRLAIRTIAATLVVATALGGLVTLLVAAMSAFFFYTHLTVDNFAAGPLAWVLNPAVWLTPVLFIAAAVIAFRATRSAQPKDLFLSLGFSIAAAMIVWTYWQYDPLLEIESCFDAGGVWKNGACSQ